MKIDIKIRRRSVTNRGGEGSHIVWITTEGERVVAAFAGSADECIEWISAIHQRTALAVLCQD